MADVYSLTGPWSRLHRHQYIEYSYATRLLRGMEGEDPGFDKLLDMMDGLWVEMTDEERDLTGYEGVDRNEPGYLL